MLLSERPASGGIGSALTRREDFNGNVICAGTYLRSLVVPSGR